MVSFVKMKLPIFLLPTILCLANWCNACWAYTTHDRLLVGTRSEAHNNSPLRLFRPNKDEECGSALHAESFNRRSAFAKSLSFVAAGAALFSGTVAQPQHAEAIGPVKLDLINPVYTAEPCPPSKPIPGQMAMKGMKGLCVTVEADVKDASPKELEKAGVYGFVTDGETGDSVLANNPDLSTDAGQFSMIESITPKTKRVKFEFVAAMSPNKDLSKYENGIGPLDFTGLRVISYPGGQQFGAISPCEMNEFSSECEEWEEENGPYQRGTFIMKSNERTKGR